MKKLGFGCMRFPMQGQQIDMEELTQMVDTFISKGFTYFDTSYVYHGGESEKALKTVLVDRYPRDKFTITTKSPVFMLESREQFFQVFQEQLERLGADYVDYYWLHAVNGPVYKKVQEFDLVSALIQLKEEGRAKHIGFSYHDSPELLDEILTDTPELEYVQLQLNYFDWESPYVAARRCYEVCEKHGKQVIVMEPVKGGQLAKLPPELDEKLKAVRPELSMASWGLRFGASLDNTLTVLSGMSNMEQMLDNISYMENFQPLGPQEKEALGVVMTALRQNMAYDLSALAEAEKVCPKGIGLVKIGEMLNDHKRMAGYTNTCVYYDCYLGTAGRAKDCDHCGKCTACGLDVPAILKEADDTITHF